MCTVVPGIGVQRTWRGSIVVRSGGEWCEVAVCSWSWEERSVVEGVRIGAGEDD